MIFRLWDFSWPHLRAVVIALTLAAFAVQAYLYVNREALMAGYTPVTEAQLYCVPPSIVDFEHQGNGRVRFLIDDVENKLSVTGQPGLLSPEVTPFGHSAWKVEATLQPGFNTLVFDFEGSQKAWNAMFTPQEVYAATNNVAKSLPGVIGLYPSSLCMGKPVLPIAAWTPTTTTTTTTTSTTTLLSENWKNTFVDSIRRLESSRGIPDATIETADLQEVVQRLEDKSSHSWCTQIALYTVAKLQKKVPVRLVANGGLWNNDLSVRTGGHTFLEYLDPLTHRWAISDPTNYIFAVRDHEGHALNAIELSRALALPENVGIAALRFDVVNPNLKTVASKSFSDLPVVIQRDLRFYFRPINAIFFYSGRSSVFSPSLFTRINDWLQTDRRFVFQLKEPSISVVSIRIASFWLILAGIFILFFGEFAWRVLPGKQRNSV